MPDKLDQLQKLILSGYTVAAVDSDDDCVRATLRRGEDQVTLRLHRTEAQRLLYVNPLREYR